MPCGGCAQRRQAILAGVKALAQGRLGEAAHQGVAVIASAKADVRKIALAASHARLKRP
jgi:hypothetical protein